MATLAAAQNLTLNGTGAVVLIPINASGKELAPITVTLAGAVQQVSATALVETTVAWANIIGFLVVSTPASVNFNWSGSTNNPSTAGYGQVLVAGKKIIPAVEGVTSTPFDGAASQAAFTDISSSAGMVPASGAAGQRYIDVITNRKSQTGRFRVTNTIGLAGKVALRFPCGVFTTGTNSWEPLGKNTGTANGLGSTSFFVRALLYDGVSGLSVPVTFQGKRDGQVSWGWLDSDPIEIPPQLAASQDLFIYCDSYVTTVGDNLPRNRVANPQRQEAVVNDATAILDYSMPATRATMAGAVADNTAVGYCPFLIAVPTGSPRVAVMYGDSRVDCLGDSMGMVADGWEESAWYSQAALTKGASISTIAASGSRLFLDIANGFTLMQKQFAHCESIEATDFICMSWANDALNGRSAVQIKADLITLKTEVERRGMRFWVCTNPPLNCNTTDNYLTAANMTVANAGVEAIRVSVNTAIRLDNTYGFKVEIANALESAQDSGKFKDAVLDPNGPFVINTTVTAATNCLFTTGGVLSYGRWRNDLMILTGNITAGLAGVVKIISNFFFFTPNNRVDYTVAMTAAVGDTFNRWQRYTHDGLHWRTELAQLAAGAALADSGALG